ncbi:MAG: hypothetical protein O2815_08025 [Actinomycetota bacterium]|nr:hypothetical protein [Actinomycetota bacterium]
MTNPSWSKLRHDALDSVQALVSALDDQESDDPTLIAAYLEAKSTLATAFAQLARERFGQDQSLNAAVELVRSALDAFSEVPEAYRRMRHFSASHRILLAYLVRNVGKPVTAASLKMINHEQSETERRTRELRTLGFDIEATHSAGQQTYTLKSAVPDTALGARHQIAEQIRGDRKLTSDERDVLLREYGVDV